MGLRRLLLALLASVALAAATCDALAPSDYERYSSAAGLLIGDGDVDEGRAVFLALKCHTCHTVYRLSLPAPEGPLEQKVEIGGEVDALPTDGYLATSIINPAHELAEGYAREIISENGVSRMADYSDVVTLRQLKDLVAFLHSRYYITERDR